MEKELFSGRYQIIEKLGSGGMADVFKARDTILNRTVAIKILHPQFAQEKNFIERLRREAQAAANLNHPNIVSIFDWGSQNNTYYIVMEYLSGKTLKEIIEEEAPLSAKKVIDIANHVCAALQFAHRREVIHRDIKPHNIIITSEGDIKVTDFGIARAGASPSLTQTGSIVGTPQYISPEQAQGRPVQRTSDIYSLGTVMYEMLTGRVPFEGDNPITIAFKQVHEMPVPPRVINPAVPRSLETVTLRALAKNPAERYQSAEAMQTDLALCAAGQVVTAPRPEPAISIAEETMVIPSRRQRYKKKKKRRLGPWLLLFFLLLASVTLAYFLLTNLAPPSVAVPNIEGKTVAEAQSILRDRGLKLKVLERAFSNAVDLGLIMNQDPEAGSKIAEGGIVKVAVSKGAETIKAPDVIGQTSEEAGFILGQAGLRIGSTDKVFSDNIPEGLVVDQSPKPGKKIPKGTAVNITISKGEEVVSVPDVIGKNSAEATALIAEAGLKVSQREEFSDTIPSGQIIRQSPQPLTEAKKGSTVSIVISKGVETVGVPNVRELTAEEAKARLESLDLVVDTRYIPSDQKGKVIEQYPAPDAKVKKGSTVTISVGN